MPQRRFAPCGGLACSFGNICDGVALLRGFVTPIKNRYASRVMNTRHRKHVGAQQVSEFGNNLLGERLLHRLSFFKGNLGVYRNLKRDVALLDDETNSSART